ncbi:MAG TPA: class I SAM-dependent methyltransferase [Bacteroidales bacterium]|nr:class I SAM-dependent methyltransferase [Bacteroidales bacterium]
MLLHLKPDRERSVLRRHPWIFSGAVGKIDKAAEPGQTMEIVSSSGKWLARGAISPASQIIVRIWTFDPVEEVDETFFQRRLKKAILYRQLLYGGSLSAACRLVYAENDGLPGVIIDKYGDFMVCQFLSAGAERWKDTIVRILEALIPCRGIYERSDAEVRLKEGLAPKAGVLAGQQPPDLVHININDLTYPVDVKKGHKTGFYLDQSVNRSIVASLSENRDVLNCFCYTGSFTAAALAGGAASVCSVETSAEALQLARQTLSVNNLDASRATFIEDDVFHRLRLFRDEARSFDLIILDPPKFAESRSQLEKASRGYKDINLLAFKLLRPNGTLVTFSCSGLVTRELFGKIVADAALDAGKEARILQWLTQAPDHPVVLSFPEGMYLKGMAIKISD